MRVFKIFRLEWDGFSWFFLVFLSFLYKCNSKHQQKQQQKTKIMMDVFLMIDEISLSLNRIVQEIKSGTMQVCRLENSFIGQITLNFREIYFILNFQSNRFVYETESNLIWFRYAEMNDSLETPFSCVLIRTLRMWYLICA